MSITFVVIMSTGFGPRLRALRQAKGLSQKALAEQVGLSLSAVQQHEQGLRSPTWETVLKYCEVFGVECGAFAAADGPASPPPPVGRPPKAEAPPAAKKRGKRK